MPKQGAWKYILMALACLGCFFFLYSILSPAKSEDTFILEYLREQGKKNPALQRSLDDADRYLQKLKEGNREANGDQ